jgi:4a-hydroxytetrahydrobiopterin dehydratase
MDSSKTPRPEPLDDTDVAKRLSTLPGWSPAENSISATFSFGGFPDAIGFVNRVAALAEEAGHHPDIDIRWNKVALVLSTHSAGGLTPLDFDLAAKISAL